MKNIYFTLILLTVLLISCNKNDSDRKHYNSYYKLKARNIEKSGLNKESGVFMFYDLKENNKNRPCMVGAYLDGFRNDVWQYKGIGDSLKFVRWSYYKDKYMNIETNLFQEVDTCIYGDNYSTLIFILSGEKIKFTIALNSEIIKKTKDEDYIQLLKKEFRKVNVEIVSSQFIKLEKAPNLKAYKIVVSKSGSLIRSYIYSIYTKLKNGSIVDLAVQTNRENSFLAKVLFDATISNTYVEGERLYNPWK